MEFTFVTQCHCGCETFDIISVTTPDVNSAMELLERDWEREEQSISIIAAFKGVPEVLHVPSRFGGNFTLRSHLKELAANGQSNKII